MPRSRLPLIACLTALALAACNGEATPTQTPAAGDAQIERVLSRLPDCGDPPPEQDIDRVEGLVTPEGVRWTGREQDGPLTTVTGWIGLTPVEVKRFYERRTVGVLKPLMIEDEILEAEALMESRTHRLYIKAQSACRDASLLWIVVAEHEAGAELPQPGSTDVPGPPAPSVAP